MKKRQGAALMVVIVLLVFVIIISITLIRISNTSSKQNYISRDHAQADLLAESGLNVFLSYLTSDENKAAFNIRYKNHLSANAPNGKDVPLIIELNELDYNPNNNAVLYITSENLSGNSTKINVSSVGNYNGVTSITLKVEIIWVVNDSNITYSYGPYEN